MLKAEFTARFHTDVKRLKRKHADLKLLKAVIRLVLTNDANSIGELRRRHNMRDLQGSWQGSKECHVANREDWLGGWQVSSILAVFLRTGTHEEIFR